MKYFKNITDLSELRKQYKELLKVHHPDNGGNVADMQEINAEYDSLFKMLKDNHYNKATDSDKTSYNANMYNWENDKVLREILEKITNFDGIEIEIIGQWIWISGNTYNFRKALKNLGFKWASQKKQWYWHSEVSKKKSRKSLSMDDIRSYYGATKVYTSRALLEA